MGATIAQARDSIYGLFRTGWLTNGAVSSVPLLFPGIKQNRPADGSPYLELVINHEENAEQPLTAGLGAIKLNRRGVFRVVIRTPTGDGLTINDELAQAGIDILEAGGAARGVWFSEIVAQELGVERDMFTTQLQTRFRYQEFKTL